MNACVGLSSTSFNRLLLRKNTREINSDYLIGWQKNLIGWY